MKKKYIALIVFVLVFLALTPGAFRLAYLQRGYRRIGGEALLPLYGVLLWSVWQDMKAIFNPEKYEVAND